MRFAAKIALIAGLLLCGISALAADLAVLRNGFTLRHERREVVGDAVRLYPRADSADFVEVRVADVERYEAIEEPPPAPRPLPPPFDLDKALQAAGARHGIDPDFLRSVIRAESGFNPRAVSPKGARGLMQLMPGTSRQLGLQDAFDPAANLDAGTRHLRELFIHYDGDTIKALAAYNAGASRVDRYRGVPPYRETRGYVNRIVRDFNRQKRAQQPAASTHPPRATSRTVPQAD